MPFSLSRLMRATACVAVFGGALLVLTDGPAVAEEAGAAVKKKKGAKPDTRVADDKDDPKRAAAAKATTPGTSVVGAAPAGGAAPLPEASDEFGPQLPPTDNVLVAVPKREPIGRGKVFAAVRIGAAIPQVVSSLSASFLVGAEAGWAAPKLPGIGEGLAFAIDVAFSQPSSSGTATDSHAGGMYTWSVTQKTTSLGLTVLYRAPFIQSASMERGKLVPYIGVGPRLFFLQTLASAQPGGAAVADYTETSSKIGFGVPFGADYVLGPGRVFLEGMFMWAPFKHNTTGESNAGALTLEAGYRMFFGLGG